MQTGQDRVVWFISIDAVAGTLFLLNTFAYLAFWYPLLFVAQPQNLSVIDAALQTLAYGFANEDTKWIFIWASLAPVVNLLFAVVYYLKIAESKNGAMALLILGVAWCVLTIIFGTRPYIVWTFLAVYCGWRCYLATMREQARLTSS